MIQILDVYSENRFDFQQEKATGTSGIIFKGGQGEWPDVPRVHPEWFAQCLEAGLPFGVYWLVDARYSPERHKAAIYRTFPNGEFGKLGLWLDCEKPKLALTDWLYSKLPYAYWRPIESVARGVIKNYGFQPGIYTSPGAWKLIFGKCPKEVQTWFAQAPLWTAQYKSKKADLYGAWSEYKLWQYQGEPDYSIFNGTDSEFRQWIGQEAKPDDELVAFEKAYSSAVIPNDLHGAARWGWMERAKNAKT